MFFRLMILSLCFYSPFVSAQSVSSLPVGDAVPTEVLPENRYGKFENEVIAKWLPDGRRMELAEKLVYVDPDGKVWDAPKGHLIDGASIPEALWSFTGGPYSGKYRNASVIHDAACDLKNNNWWSVHKVFYYAMRASGVPEAEAQIKYLAVYNFGPRWDEDSAGERLSKEQLQKIIDDPKRRSNAVDALLSGSLVDSGAFMIAGFNDVTWEVANYLKRDLTRDLAQKSFDVKAYFKDDFVSHLKLVLSKVTIKNTMMVLALIVLLQLVMLISTKLWLYSLVLLVILFVIDYF